jgi:hypothetical protein
MKLSYKDIINKHKNKIGLCVGLGPSLRLYDKEVVNCAKNKNDYCCFSVNTFHRMIDLQADYRVLANSVITIDRLYKEYNEKPETALLTADTVDTTDKRLVEKILKIDYLQYDQRHFNHKTCQELYGCSEKRKCCEHIDPNRLTIQEELAKYTNSEFTYGTGSTVSLHMLAFCILSGCKEIYIFGIDLDYSKGYYDGITINHDSFDPYLVEIVQDFKIINMAAKKIGVNIYSCTPESKINKYVEFKPFV